VKEEHDPALAALMEQISQARGLCCSAYKVGCFKRRLTVRMRARGVATYRDYAHLLAEDPTEYDRLLDALTINVTRFYRNPEAWDVLAARMLPRLWAARAGAVRCWSAGCSSGEEPYTLAMLLADLARRGGDPVPAARVDATDLDPQILEQARLGRYPRAMLREAPPDLIGRYFDAGDPAAVVPGVRDMVRFARHDMLRDPPPNLFYMILRPPRATRTSTRFRYTTLFAGLTAALAPDGYLVLGKVEAVWGEVRSQLALEDLRERVYRRR